MISGKATRKVPPYIYLKPLRRRESPCILEGRGEGASEARLRMTFPVTPTPYHWRKEGHRKWRRARL